MGRELAAIRRRFGPEDLRPLLAANDVDRTILVQTLSSEDETREFLEIAEANEFVAGVVGWVDLTAPDVTARIARLRASPGGAKLVGIRHQAHDEPDAEWLTRDDVRRGIAAIGDAGLVYDLLVRARELPAAAALARALPGVRFVVDHLGKPPIRERRIEDWSERMVPLATLPNVFCKLSGMVTEADWQTWTIDDLVPYVRRALEWFGPQRCMFGSDWPVCLLAGSYEEVLSACRRAVGNVSATDSERIFGMNATLVYQPVVPATIERSG
jgi:L-fuconolactonase